MPREYTLKSFRAPVELNIDYEAELNAQQFAAVSAPPGPALVLAGAGAGKTRTLTYRVAYLLEQGIPVDRILLLTFTNKAAREMMDRVQNLIGGGHGGALGRHVSLGWPPGVATARRGGRLPAVVHNHGPRRRQGVDESGDR